MKKLIIITAIVLNILLVASIINYNNILYDSYQHQLTIATLEDTIVRLESDLGDMKNKRMIESIDYILLLHITESEVTGGTVESKRAVAEVVLNRVASDKFPNTIQEVIFQHRQFSPVLDLRLGTLPITKSTVQAVKLALTDNKITNDSLYFICEKQADTDNLKWFRTLEYTVSYYPHEFFK